MADRTIYELTQEPSLQAADRFAVQQTSAATETTSATFALMGGLEINAIGTVGNTTGTVGTLDVWTMAGEAANRTWTLPGTAQVGERCGVYIVDGDATDEILIHADASADKIGNSTGFHSAGTEFTRLFIENECMIFRCVSATNPDWIVEYDGRIPCAGELHLNAASENISNATVTEWSAFDANGVTQGHDVGGILSSTDGRITARRDGVLQIVFQATPSDTFVNEARVAILYDPDTAAHYIGTSEAAAASAYPRLPAIAQYDATAGDVFGCVYRHAEGTNETLFGASNNKSTSISVTEIL